MSRNAPPKKRWNDVSRRHHWFPHEMTSEKRAQNFQWRFITFIWVVLQILLVESLLHPIRSTTQIRVVTRHQYGISAVVSQTSYRWGETSGGVARETIAEFSMALHSLYLGSASNTIGCKFASSNQKNYPDPGSDASSVWNFCVRFSDIISRGNQWWRRKLSAVF